MMKKTGYAEREESAEKEGGPPSKPKYYQVTDREAVL